MDSEKFDIYIISIKTVTFSSDVTCLVMKLPTSTKLFTSMHYHTFSGIGFEALYHTIFEGLYC